MQSRPRVQTLRGLLSTVCALVFGLTLTLLSATASAQSPSAGASSAQPAAAEPPSAAASSAQPAAAAESPAAGASSAQPAAAAEPPSVVARSPQASAPTAAGEPSGLLAFDEPRSPRIGQWLAIGYDNGLWGSGFAQGVRVDIPLADHFALRLRSLLVNTPQFRAPADPVIDSGAELIGRSSVLLRLLRLYGGGGFWVGARPNPTAEGKKVRLAGGGFLGMEAFASPQLAFTLEVGGQGAGHGLKNDAGASVMGGLLYYFGR